MKLIQIKGLTQLKFLRVRSLYKTGRLKNEYIQAKQYTSRITGELSPI